MKRSKTSSAGDYNPVIWGHRGCRGEFDPVENTIPAVLKAIRQGADGVEFDVRLTSDNVPIIFHDKTLDRLTNGSGRVRKTPYPQLCGLRVYNKGSKIPAENDPLIPTLDQMLDAIEPHLLKNPKFKVNIEIKGKEAPFAVADAVLKRLSGGKWSEENFHISGFKMDRLKIIRELLPTIEIGALYVQNLGDRLPYRKVYSLLHRAFKEMEEIGARTINLPIEYYSKPDVAQKIRKAGFEPVAWTYEEKVPKAASNGRDVADYLRRIIEDNITIITDFPEAMRSELREAARMIAQEYPKKSAER